MNKAGFLVGFILTICLPTYAFCERTVYAYDAKGNLLEEHTAYLHGWSKKSRTYDSIGNMLTETHESNKGVFSRDEKKFDDRNNMIYHYHKTPASWMKYVRTYDRNGNELTVENISADYHSLITKKYNSKSRQIGRETRYFGKNARIVLETFTYNGQGLLDEKKHSFKDQVWRTKYSYNGNKQILTEIKTNNKNQIEFTLENKYDDKGNKIESYSKNPLYGMWSKTIYVYDSKNRLIEEKRTSNGGSVDQKKMKYNLHGNMIELYKFYKNKQNREGSWNKTVFTYYKNNRMIKEFRREKSGSANTHNITYNRNGLKISEYYGSRSGEWLKHTYGYDKSGRLIKKYTKRSSSGGR